MSDNLITGLILVAVLLLLVLVVYIVDRLNAIEKKATLPPTHGGSAESPAETLTGKLLWDAIVTATSSRNPSSLSDTTRSRHWSVLTKHIETVFNNGVMDASLSLDSPPEEILKVNTLRGTVESFLPSEFSNEIYECGQSHKSGGVTREELAKRLDAIGSRIAEKLGQTDKGPLSKTLLGSE
jgi:hypothetical protein